MVSKKFFGNAEILSGMYSPLSGARPCVTACLQINFEIWIIGAVKLHT
jgi:hypothetical protein